MDALMGNDLDQLAQVVAGVLHGERPDGGNKPGSHPVVPAAGKDGGGMPNQHLKPKGEQDPAQMDSERMKQSGASRKKIIYLGSFV